MGQTFTYFKDQTLSQISDQLNVYQQRAVKILNKISSQKRFLEKNKNYQMALSYYEDMLINKRDADSANNEDLKLMYNRERQHAYDYLMEIRNAEHYEKIYLEGYELLNEIGHYFHEQWNYQITIFGKETYSFIIPMEEFLKVTRVGLFGIDLASKTKIFEQFKNTQYAIKWDDSRKDKYNKKLYDTYVAGVEYARKVAENGGIKVTKKGKGYNTGQLIEGYMAYGEDTNNLSVLSQLSNLAQGNHLGQANFSILANMLIQLQEQTNNKGFWSGPDTKYQEKGEGASIFSYDTIENQLTQVKDLFLNLNFSRLEKEQGIVQGEAKELLQQKVDFILNDLLMGVFDLTKPQGYTVDEINNIIQEII